MPIVTDTTYRSSFNDKNTFSENGFVYKICTECICINSLPMISIGSKKIDPNCNNIGPYYTCAS